MGEYFTKERIKPFVRFLSRIGMVAVTILLVNMLGLWVFLFSQGQSYILTSAEFLAGALLLEGSLIGAVGGFLYLAFTMYSVEKQQATDQAGEDEQAKKRRERRMSRQKWASAMIILGAFLIFLGFVLGS